MESDLRNVRVTMDCPDRTISKDGSGGVSPLARLAQMSAPNFRRHSRVIPHLRPLQFQKRILPIRGVKQRVTPVVNAKPKCEKTLAFAMTAGLRWGTEVL